MTNFYVPNYTKEEFEELDNKVLLLSKEKYTQLGIKFNDYNPIVDTKKIICSISYNDPKVNYIIYDDIENVKLFDELGVNFWYTVLIQYFLLTARIGSNEAQDNLKYFFNISVRKDRTALNFLKVNQNKNSGICIKLAREKVKDEIFNIALSWGIDEKKLEKALIIKRESRNIQTIIKKAMRLTRTNEWQNQRLRSKKA